MRVTEKQIRKLLNQKPMGVRELAQIFSPKANLTQRLERVDGHIRQLCLKMVRKGVLERGTRVEEVGTDRAHLDTTYRIKTTAPITAGFRRTRG
jgi:hypothetical protein